MRKQQVNALRLTLLSIALLALISIALPTIASACPFCSDAVAQQKAQGLGEGLNYTVIAMAGMPFLLFGTVAGILARAFSKRRRSQFLEFQQHDLN